LKLEYIIWMWFIAVDGAVWSGCMSVCWSRPWAVQKPCVRWWYILAPPGEYDWI